VTHRGPCQPLLFCDSVLFPGTERFSNKSWQPPQSDPGEAGRSPLCAAGSRWAGITAPLPPAPCSAPALPAEQPGTARSLQAQQRRRFSPASALPCRSTLLDQIEPSAGKRHCGHASPHSLPGILLPRAGAHLLLSWGVSGDSQALLCCAGYRSRLL